MKLPAKIGYFIASGLGSGYVKHAPGTFGSLAFLVIWLVVKLTFNPGLYFFIISLLLITVIGVISTEICLKNEKEQKKNNKDPGWIVIDEWLGLGTALLPLSQIQTDSLSFFILSIGAFILFRIFDILKPFPIKYFEKLPSSTGIMSDDLIAGIFAATILICIL